MAPTVSFKAAAAPLRPLAGLRRAASKAQKAPVASTSKEMMVWTPNDNKCAAWPLPGGLLWPRLARRPVACAPCAQEPLAASCSRTLA